VGVTPPLRANHAAGAGIVPVIEGSPLGELNRAAAAGDSELEVAGHAAPPAGAVVQAGADHGRVDAVSERPGAIGSHDSMALIRGIVTDTGDPAVPIPGAHVRLVELNHEVRTDVAGRYGFGLTPGGEYTLRVSAAGYADKTQAVTVPATGQNEFRVRMSPA
jgi:hypothetical protein